MFNIDQYFTTGNISLLLQVNNDQQGANQDQLIVNGDESEDVIQLSACSHETVNNNLEEYHHQETPRQQVELLDLNDVRKQGQVEKQLLEHEEQFHDFTNLPSRREPNYEPSKKDPEYCMVAHINCPRASKIKRVEKEFIRISPQGVRKTTKMVEKLMKF